MYFQLRDGKKNDTIGYALVGGWNACRPFYSRRRNTGIGIHAIRIVSKTVLRAHTVILARPSLAATIALPIATCKWGTNFVSSSGAGM